MQLDSVQSSSLVWQLMPENPSGQVQVYDATYWNKQEDLLLNNIVDIGRYMKSQGKKAIDGKEREEGLNRYCGEFVLQNNNSPRKVYSVGYTSIATVYTQNYA